MRRLPLLSLVALMAGGRAYAAPLLLEVWLKGEPGAVVEVTREDGHLYIPVKDFAALKLTLRWHGDHGRVDLSQLPGLKAVVDEANQRLTLEVDTAALPQQRFDLREQPTLAETPTDRGAMLHYGLSVTTADMGRFGPTTVGGGDFALDAFTALGQLHNTGFASATVDGFRGARLETSLLFERPDKMTHLSVGDAISVTPNWGRSVRFAGFQYASDFSLRPDLVTQPLPNFFGQTAVPATVDVFNGAVKVYQQQVGAGPFTLNNLPVVTGGGNATVVTTDVLGRQTTQTIALFSDPGMLAPGLESFAIDMGFLRHGYGESSFDYRDALLSGTWRKGLSNYLTLQAHGETATNLALVGGGGEFGFGIGTISADIAGSHTKGGDGSQISLSVQALRGPFNAYARAQWADKNYRDLASLDAGSPPARERYQAGVTWDMRKWGVLGASWLETRNSGDKAHTVLTNSWSVNLPHNLFFSLTGLKDITDHSLSLQMSLSLALDDGSMAGLNASTGERDQVDMLYTKNADPTGGFGYRALLGNEMNGRALAGVTWIGDDVALDGSLATQNGQGALQANADGALVFLRGSVFATHNPGEAVALVDAGAPNVRIYLENRQVAKSGADGTALVTGLNPHAPNQIAVESRDYPFETELDKTDMVVVPRRHAGVMADLSPPKSRMLTMQVTNGGSAPHMGARILVDGETKPVFVGHDGKFQVAGLTQARGATLEDGAQHCRLMLDPKDTRPVLCLRETASAY